MLFGRLRALPDDAVQRSPVAGVSEHARRASDVAGPGDHFVRGAAGGFLGLAAWAQGEVSTALPTFTQAMASLHAAGDLANAKRHLETAAAFGERAAMTENR